MVKKRELLIFIFGLILISVISAAVLAKIEVSKKAIVDSVVSEIGKPAKYEITIKNLGEDDKFSIYSLIGVNIKPNATYAIANGETKTVEIELMPDNIETSRTISFIYKIKGEVSGITEDDMLIRVSRLRDAIEINSYTINLETKKTVVYVKNRLSFPFGEVKIGAHSDFFDFSKTLTLDAYEKKEFEVQLNTAKLKSSAAGSYVVGSNIETNGVKGTTESSFLFTEKADIITRESKEGFIIYKHTIEKINDGNIPTLVQVNMKKNIITRLFTTFNTEPVKIEREGFDVNYAFQKEIGPGETFAVKAVSNWLYPLILVAAIICVILVVRAYTSTFLLLKKKVAFVKTTSGNFALKITLVVRAKKFVEKISVIDKIPGIVKLHERFGAIAPDKFDEKTGRLKWTVDNLQPGEERIFSYIIYTKLAPVGKFELPTATAVFEREGRIHETESNKVFFLTEMRRNSV